MNQQILAEKKDVVAQINGLLKNSHSTVVVSYSGMSVADITELRINLKKAGAYLEVRKNSLLKKAVDEDGLKELEPLLKGPNALVTSPEEGEGLNVLKEFAARHKEFTIKGAYIGNMFCDADKVAALAAVGSKQNAISILLSTMQSPLVKLGLTLKALSEKAPQA